MNERSYWTYIVASTSGTLYIGMTNDRYKRIMDHKNGVIEESGLAAAVLNHPANGVAWLANKLSDHDEGLAAGELVLGGSFTRPVACSAGDVFHADYGPLGSIAVRFV